MKKVIISIMIIALPLFFFLSSAIPFDTVPGKFKEFPEGQEYVDVSDSICQITVIGTAEGLYPDFDSWDGRNPGALRWKRAVGVFGQAGSAFHIGNGYFVTNAHVVRPQLVQIDITKNFAYIVPVNKVLSIQLFIGNGWQLGSAPVEIYWISEERDIAIVHVIGNWAMLRDNGYRPAWTYTDEDNIHSGDSVAVIVAKRNEDGSKGSWFEVRYGQIIAPRPILPKYVNPHALPWFSLTDVTMDVKLYPGDSGSPVFAFIEGKPVIIGVARAFARGCDYSIDECAWFSYFTRIDPIVTMTLEKENK